jgi:hypothetical protein
VAGDEVYGADPTLRETLEDRGVGYVLAVACNHQIRTDAHITTGTKTGTKTGKRAGKIRADELATSLPRKAWQCLSAGDGSKGPRYYDWAWISIRPERVELDGRRRQWWLLIRRNNTSGELAYYRCWAPTPVPLRQLVHVAGRRWTSWRRWTLLAMLAYAFLAAVAVTEKADNPVPQEHSLIALTRNEIKRLFNTFKTFSTQPILDLRHRLRWSIRRRRHQHRARASHYRRRQANPTRTSRSPAAVLVAGVSPERDLSGIAVLVIENGAATNPTGPRQLVIKLGNISSGWSIRTDCSSNLIGGSRNDRALVVPVSRPVRVDHSEDIQDRVRPLLANVLVFEQVFQPRRPG